MSLNAKKNKLFMSEIVKLLIFSSTSFIVLFIISKILGKKQISQLDFIDYVVGISLGSIAAAMATDVTDTPFYYYIIAMAIYFVLDILIMLLSRKGPVMKHFLNGKPFVIVYNGKINYKNLKSSHLTINDVLSLCREQGYFDLNKIEYALFEPSGQISIMPVGEEKPTVAKDVDIPIQQASLPNYLVVDGKISYSSLTELGYDESWLLWQLNIQDKKQLKQIILAQYDTENKKVVTHYKE